ncbi:MAG: hypothetical protein PHN82_04060, partial [bacterium]|nr:hypothetical protein [bacterium]
TVYAGGAFPGVGGAARNCLPALHAAGSGTATDWNPDLNSTVRAIAVCAGTVYAGGDFTTVGGDSRSRFARFDLPALKRYDINFQPEGMEPPFGFMPAHASPFGVGPSGIQFGWN